MPLIRGLPWKRCVSPPWRLRREKIPEYPIAALGEAITNAVMHRDWFNEGANVFVEIYTDRIEVSNPGGLPKGMLPSDLGHKSVRRNPLIADLLHRIEFIEKAGSGIKRMREEARAQGCPEPTFEATGFFTTTFLPNPAVRAQAEAQGRDQVTEQAGTKLAPSQRQVQAHDEAHEPLTKAEREILAACAGEPQRTPDLLRLMGYSTRTGNFKKALTRLLALGRLEMTIPGKPRSSKQHYKTTSLGRKALAREKRKG